MHLDISALVPVYLPCLSVALGHSWHSTATAVPCTYNCEACIPFPTTYIAALRLHKMRTDNGCDVIHRKLKPMSSACQVRSSLSSVQAFLPYCVSSGIKSVHSGLWRYSRHPNHVGEQMFWWGLAMFAVSSGDFWTLIGPLFNTVCMVKCYLDIGSTIPIAARGQALAESFDEMLHGRIAESTGNA